MWTSDSDGLNVPFEPLGYLFYIIHMFSYMGVFVEFANPICGFVD
jgi:hypothetical protein